MWRALADSGALRACLPSSRGGLGMDESALVPMLEAVGRAALPLPVTATAAVATPLLGRDPGTDRIVSDLGGRMVAHARDADLFLLCHDSGLHLVAADEVLMTMDDPGPDAPDDAAMVEFVPRGRTLVTDDPELIDASFDRGALGTAAELVGLTGRVLDLLRPRPVPTARLEDATTSLRATASALLRAAHSLAARSPEANREVSLAKTTANDIASAVARLALDAAPPPAEDDTDDEGIGASADGLDLLLPRLWVLTRTFGDSLFHRGRLGRTVLTDPGSLLF